MELEIGDRCWSLPASIWQAVAHILLPYVGTMRNCLGHAGNQSTAEFMWDEFVLA